MRTLNDHQDFEARLLDIEFYTGPSQRVLSRMRCSVSQLVVVVGGVYKATVDTANGRQHIREALGVARGVDVKRHNPRRTKCYFEG